MRTIALDTNLLLLFIVGFVSPATICKHKRLRAFSLEDFEILLNRVGDADLFSIPNVVTETSNLLTQGVSDPLKSDLIHALRVFVERSNERYVESRKVCARREFVWLGLTDSAWLECLDKSVELITADLKLFLAAEAIGLRATNFNHLRDTL